MNVYLQVDLQEIFSIRWADAQKSLGYVIVSGKAHQLREASWDEVSGAVPLPSVPVIPMQNSGPPPGSSLPCQACHTLS